MRKPERSSPSLLAAVSAAMAAHMLHTLTMFCCGLGPAHRGVESPDSQNIRGILQKESQTLVRKCRVSGLYLHSHGWLLGTRPVAAALHSTGVEACGACTACDSCELVCVAVSFCVPEKLEQQVRPVALLSWRRVADGANRPRCAYSSGVVTPLRAHRYTVVQKRSLCYFEGETQHSKRLGTYRRRADAAALCPARPPPLRLPASPSVTCLFDRQAPWTCKTATCSRRRPTPAHLRS